MLALLAAVVLTQDPVELRVKLVAQVVQLAALAQTLQLAPQAVQLKVLRP